MWQLGRREEEGILRNILNWASLPESNLSVLILAGPDFVDGDMQRLLSS